MIACPGPRDPATGRDLRFGVSKRSAPATASERPFTRYVRCADGLDAVRMRPIRPDGRARLVFHREPVGTDGYLRFFNVHPELSEKEVEHFTGSTTRIASRSSSRATEIVAVGRYDRLPRAAEAEVAFVVTDELQHHGIGTLLLDELAAAAWARGIMASSATDLAENRGCSTSSTTGLST